MTRTPQGLFIDGQWVAPRSGADYEVPNPATEETVAKVADGGRADVAAAVAAARRAFDDGPWPHTSAEERARMLERVADGADARKEELRALLVDATGATALTHGVQLDLALEQLRGYAEQVRRFEFEEALPAVEGMTATGVAQIHGVAARRPAGVCALIPTWNFPLWTTVQKLGPALAAGCTMVVKPSPYGPLVDLLLAEVLADCDLPAGVVNVVTGTDPELGAALTGSAEIDCVSFTGSGAVGKRIVEACAPTLKRVHLELGGKSANIVLDDADLATAAPSAASPAYFHAGQGCAMATRVLVSRARHDELVDAMKGFIDAFVKVGDPADPTTVLGPVIRAERRAGILELVGSGVDEGADLVCGGGRPAGLERGYFVEPTLFANVRNDQRIAREEVFGPVVAVIPYDDEDDAVRIANRSHLGLHGNVMTADVERGLALACRLRTGGVSINNAMNLLHAPFGGFKESGIGREGGRYGIEQFTELQALTWPQS